MPKKHPQAFRLSANGIKAVPPRLHEAATFAWLQRAKNGPDRDLAVKRLIEGHVGLAGAVAARYAVQRPERAEELVAYAMYILVTATNRIAEGELMTQHENYDAYIHVVLQRELKRFLRRDQVVQGPSNVPGHFSNDLAHPISYGVFDMPTSTMGRHIPHQLLSSAADRDFNFVVDDIVIQSQFFTSIEQRIIFARLDGYDDNEIGQMLHLSPGRVQQLRSKMQARLERLTEEKA